MMLIIDILVRQGRGIIARVLLLIMFCSTFISPLQAAQMSAPSLFSDRAADIINATPFALEDFIIPGGLSGKGEIIGIADSGLDRGSLTGIHPDFSGLSGDASRTIALESVSDRSIPDDPSGHGTHMAGIMVGSGKASQGRYRGIAPGSSLFFQALLDQQGEIRVPPILAQLYDPAYATGVRVYVNGWGTASNGYNGQSRQIDTYMANHPDFLAIFGAGNDGPASGSLSAEANSKNALVIGAGQVPRPGLDADCIDTADILTSSSRGPTADGRIKPDLIAPGANIVAASSSLIESNFNSNERYSVLSGTSMASAVTAGCVALLREYLESNRHLNNPSAALIKAILINGSRFNSKTVSSQGFGLLDLAGAILPINDRTVEFINQANVADQQTREYRISIDESASLFKATLTWTDPPSSPGAAKALVNNLNLTVKDPEGRIYRGNDFWSSGRIDEVNNTEQVVIPNAKAGEYTVYVNAAKLDAAYSQQAYALVYGQAMQHDTVTADAAGILSCSSGKTYSRHLEYDQGELLPAGQQPASRVGGELYWNQKNAYLFLKTWESSGVQMLTTLSGSFIMESNPRAREGGYYLDETWDKSGQVSVNGHTIDQSESFPNGAHVSAVVNPLHQLLWQVNAGAHQVEGYIKRVDVGSRQIWLINDDQPYKLYRGAAINVNNSLDDSAAEAMPYGFSGNIDVEGLLPGMKVKMLLTPQTRLVNYITVQRDLIIGQVSQVSIENESIELTNGSVYSLFPGTQIYRDDMAVSLEDLQIGDYAVGQRLPDSTQWLHLEAYSKVVYGRVIYFNDNTQTLFFFNKDNQIQKCQLDNQTRSFRWGSLMSDPAFEPGDWMRILMQPQGDAALRLDVAATFEVSEKTLSRYDDTTHMFVMSDGSLYQWLPSSLVSSGGYALKPEDMIRDREVKVTTLAGDNGKTYLAAIEGDKNPGAAMPMLNFTVQALNGALIIKGHSDADQMVIYRQDGSRIPVQLLPDGSFSLLLLQNPTESVVKAVAINTSNGSVLSREEAVTPYAAPNPKFKDLQESPWQKEITKLSERGVIQGYDDGAFRPFARITRMELIGMITNYLNLKPTAGQETGFIDEEQIPWWGKGAIKAAYAGGLIEGYEDNSFRPDQAATRSEMALIMDRIYRRFGNSGNGAAAQPAQDLALAPDWAQDAIVAGYQRGVWPGSWRSAFKPHDYVSRQEAAFLVSQL